jgi:acetyl-CoA C-acetyltransferase
MSSKATSIPDSPHDAVILSAVRTPIGRFLGGLKDFTAPKLGSLAIAEAVKRSRVDGTKVEEVIMGHVVSAGCGQAPARQASRGAGLPDAIGAFAVNKVCGSGLKAVALAAQAVKTGDASVVVAGGMESMSNAPHLLKGAREGLRMGHATMLDSMIHDGLWDPYHDYHMGMTAELVAERYGVTRGAQDEYSLQSHQKAIAAMEGGRFRDEIVPIELKGRKGEVTRLEADESPRRDTTLEALGKLRPAFKPDGGTVTAGNAPGLNDGAAALVVTSREWAEKNGLQPLATIRGASTHGLAPEMVMMAPEGAVRKLLDRLGWSVGDVDLFELNEAFAVQQCALRKQLELPEGKHNVHGGAVALGHPIGASGARVLVTLIHALRQRGEKRGIAALCLGGGNAVAMAIETA